MVKSFSLAAQTLVSVYYRINCPNHLTMSSTFISLYNSIFNLISVPPIREARAAAIANDDHNHWTLNLYAPDFFLLDHHAV